MAFKDISAPTKYYKYKDCAPGQVLATGRFLGVIEGKFGNQYEIEDDELGRVVLNKCGKIEYLIKDGRLKEGDYARFTYVAKGKIESDNSAFFGKDFHDIKVEVDNSKKPTFAKGEDKAPWDVDAVISSDEDVKV